ncbi:TPA: hypothetical protein ACNINJ_002059 [Klebsiella pneumoniae]|nr:hypothetical protein [Klebsiella pneumoniae]MBL3295808.1 hypothetical protein [Klebsiella pneumoniae]QEI53107.1 hypothetical protein FH977_19800 [Klebsiella pneumoniae]QEI57924.1 hypothetical protein FH978_19805 [Klebsiella pneumoniae]WJT64301.1 hypothetical protein QU726_19415 [Klebsiella pneumoniae]
MTITLQAVNELIASLESAGELSIREQKFLKLAKAYQQLAAENVALKAAAEFATAPDMWIEQADGMLDYRYCDWYVDVLKAAMETPATDRIVAGIKADGVEEFAAHLRANDNGASVCKMIALGAEDFAKQLREGAGK